MTNGDIYKLLGEGPKIKRMEVQNMKTSLEENWEERY